MNTKPPSIFIIQTVFVILLAVITFALIMRDEWVAAGVWAILLHLETRS